MAIENYDVKESTKLKRFCLERNLSDHTKRKYYVNLRRYVNYFDLTLEELIDEADKEEDEIVRESKRKIRERMLDFRVFLKENFSTNTIITNMNCVATFYNHFGISVPKLPRMKYDSSPNKSIEYKDLPNIDEIRTAIENSKNAKHIALFSFMACNGTSRNEIAHFKYSQFLNAIKHYCPNVETPQDIINELDGKCEELEIIPVFRMYREKTQYYYYAPISPECTQFCINYLKQEGLDLKPDDYFFKLAPNGVSAAFKLMNNKMNWGKRGTIDFFSPHRIRKFNASSIGDSDYANYIQGRKPDPIKETYFKKDVELIREEYKKYMSNFAIYTRYDVLINSEAYNQLLDEKNDLEQQLKDTKEEYEREIALLKASNNDMNSRMDSLQEQMDKKGLEIQIVEMQKKAAQHELVASTPGLMEYVMKIFEDQLDWGDRKYYSNAEIDDMVRLALATKNKIEKYENVLTEEKLKEQYPEHYDEATEIINKYKEKYIAEDLGVSLSDLQNEKVDKALLQFKKQVLEDKKNPDYIDEDITILIDPSEVQDIIDEALGLMDSVEAIYDEGMGVNVHRRFG